MRARPGPEAPQNPYDHPPLNEISVAVPVPPVGEVQTLAAGLVSIGFDCAQVRANDQARQVRCRAAVEGHADAIDRAVTVVNVIASVDGSVQYADVVLPDTPDDDPGHVRRLREVLDASFLALWPDDAGEVGAAIDTVARGPGGFDPDDPHPPLREETTTDHARYEVSEGDADTVSGTPTSTFSLVTKAVQDDSWPYGGEDYATTTTAAAPGLEAGGFDCYGPQKSPCTRVAGNQEISYEVRPGTDQILTADFFVPGTPSAEASDGLGAAGFPRGLTFLTPVVRPEVEAQVLATRLSGEPFFGIVAGSVLVIEPSVQRAPGVGTHPVEVTVGAPLVDVRLHE